MDNVATTVEQQHDPNMRTARRFRDGLKDISSACRELYNRKGRDAKQLDIASFLKGSISTEADDEPQPSKSKQAGIATSYQRWIACHPAASVLSLISSQLQ
ncbi:hypothetical protein M513_05194 [Trichuris suis]|uniref:Uncharacterized protein n=1 Tax=Trichuris suis TaxID=68888 RepID=A0A085M9N1_9BILA|nr:hypothetical protein M513_05194 [Trichuris suis]